MILSPTSWINEWDSQFTMTINPWDAKNGLFYRARPKSVLTGLRVLFTILNPGLKSGATIRPSRPGLMASLRSKSLYYFISFISYPNIQTA